MVLPSDRKPRRSIPAWMRDRATLETIRRRRLLDAGIEPLSPGTRRLAQVLDEAFQKLEQRLAEEHDQDGGDASIPF